MGLDQYLYAKKYVSPTWKGTEQQFDAIADLLEIRDFVRTDVPSAYVQVTVGYWRKANAIHEWFVQTCQDGNDDCREAYVDREQLEKLRDTCQQVLDNNSLADELLPTSAGFFFGTTDYDEWYFDRLRYTVELITNLLTNVPRDWDFSYGSSW